MASMFFKKVWLWGIASGVCKDQVVKTSKTTGQRLNERVVKNLNIYLTLFEKMTMCNKHFESIVKYQNFESPKS